MFKKKKIVILLAIVALLSVCGCENEQSLVKETTVEETTQKRQDINKTATLSNVTALEFNTDITVEQTEIERSVQIDEQIDMEIEKYNFDDAKVILNPYGNSPLTAVILFKTDSEYSVLATVKGKTKEADITGSVDASTKHRIPIIGLYADYENKVIISLIDSEGNKINTKTFVIKTDVLPDNLKDEVTVDKQGEINSFGLVEVSGFGTKYPNAFDNKGDIRWYLHGSYASYGYFPLSNNHFIVMDKKVMVGTDEKPHAQELYEMDYIGRTYNIYYTKNGAHHEIIEKTPGGNLLIATSSLEGHVEDAIEEIDRQTGKIIKSVDMQKVLGKNNKYVDLVDWAHVNTVSYCEQDNTIVCSPRNTHSIVKFDWDTDEIKWIIADPFVWKGTDNEKYVLKSVDPNIQWFYQQHSAYQIDIDLDGKSDTVEIACYDNHWTGTRKLETADSTDYSYVKVYAVNEAKSTISMLKNFSDVKSKITSNYVYDDKANTIWSMGGFVAYPDEDNNGNGSYITQFDFDTEKILNRYELKNTFYRAYIFEPDFNTCAASLDLSENNTKGTLRIAKEQNIISEIPSEIIGDEVKLTTNSTNILFVQAKDHTVEKVEFIGKEHCYAIDYTNTAGSKEYEKVNYKIAAPFQNLEPDTYIVVIKYKGKVYNSGKTITIR